MGVVVYKFSTFLNAVNQAYCNDSIKRIVDMLDGLFRSGGVVCGEKDWPVLSSAVAKRKDKGSDHAKNVWRVTFVNGKHCAMINDGNIHFDEALKNAIQRFDSKRVLTVD